MWKEYMWSRWDTLAAGELFLRAKKTEYAGGMNPNMDSYSSETIQSVFSLALAYITEEAGEIAKPDHFKEKKKKDKCKHGIWKWTLLLWHINWW